MRWDLLWKLKKVKTSLKRKEIRGVTKSEGFEKINGNLCHNINFTYLFLISFKKSDFFGTL